MALQDLNTLRPVKPPVVVHPATHHGLTSRAISSSRWWVLEDAIRQWRMVVRIALAAWLLIAGRKQVKFFPSDPGPPGPKGIAQEVEAEVFVLPMPADN